MKLVNLIPLFVILAIGLAAGYELYHPKPGKPETPAVAVRQKDGSLELERAPSGLSSQAPAGSSPLKPAQAIPKGATVERIVEVTVQPKTSGGTTAPSPGVDPGRFKLDQGTLKIPALGGLGSSQANDCPPVRVDLSLIRLKDKSQRVLASSPDGQVVGGIDVPMETAKFPKVLRWSVEGLRGYDLKQNQGVWGGEVNYERGPFVGTGGVVGTTIFVGAGFRF